MSFGNQRTAALNLTFIRRNTRFLTLLLFALLTYSQAGEVRILNVKASTRYKIRTANVTVVLKLDSPRI